ncbi:MAG: hypothetical protein AB7P12_04465 [Alphaproteobacteria bacterium]
MGALKTLVVVMGVAILIGASILVTLIVERGRRLAAAPNVGQVAGQAVEQAAAPAPAAIREHRLALPKGARVLETRLDNGRILLRAALDGGGEALFVFDAASGRLVARYALAAEGGP